MGINDWKFRSKHGMGARPTQYLRHGRLVLQALHQNYQSTSYRSGAPATRHWAHGCAGDYLIPPVKMKERIFFRNTWCAERTSESLFISKVLWLRNPSSWQTKGNVSQQMVYTREPHCRLHLTNSQLPTSSSSSINRFLVGVLSSSLRASVPVATSSPDRHTHTCSQTDRQTVHQQDKQTMNKSTSDRERIFRGIGSLLQTDVFKGMFTKYWKS